METIRYENKWPNYNEIVHISNDGLCTISICDNDIYGFGFIYNLVVHETARNQGRGQYLLDLAELEIIRTFKRRYALLRVVPGSWMEQWYRRNGYKDTGKPNTARGYIDLIKEL